MSLILECHPNCKVTGIGMSFKFEYDSKMNDTQIAMSLKLENQSIWNDRQMETSLKLKCHLDGNVT